MTSKTSSFKVFLDSDVIISSLISSKGAASFLLNLTSEHQFYISNLSSEELEIVVARLNLDKGALHSIVKKLNKIELNDPNEIETSFKEFVSDPNDAHIIAGAAKAKARFLISYNLKDYEIDRIKDKLSIQILTPALFVQYLRSRR